MWLNDDFSIIEWLKKLLGGSRILNIKELQDMRNLIQLHICLEWQNMGTTIGSGVRWTGSQVPRYNA